MSKTVQKKSFVDRFLGAVEKAGNALPHPATLFVILALVVVLLSALLSWLGVNVPNPDPNASPEDKVIAVRSLFSREGLSFIMTKTVTNFTNFAPLGTVLVALLGIGVAEGSGLIGAVLRTIVLKSPERLLTFVVVFAGVISNTASEVGYVLLVPLAAVIFLAAGKHPLAGLAAAFAGVSGGYSANLLLGTIDPLLAGISEEAAKIVDPTYNINVACNYFFMFISTFLIAALGTFVTEKIVIPKLGLYEGEVEPEKIERLSSQEKRGMLYAGISILIMVGLLLIGLLPEDGLLRGEGGSILKSPFMGGIVTLIFVMAAVAGIAYGVGARTIKNDADVMNSMANSMKSLGAYIVLVFFAAQFVEYFKWTNIGLVTAVKGADLLVAVNLKGVPLMIGFILVVAMINLVMGSASAKWTLLAPVFIPMFMMLPEGYSPEFTQLVYRIGDSTTNIISPMMSYFALIVVFIQKYQKDAGIGTVISLMLPYSIVFFIGWSILLIIWMLFGLPIGPDSPLHYPN
ncbi:MAG: AbgT family transporter [Bacteroidales bacterium]